MNTHKLTSTLASLLALLLLIEPVASTIPPAEAVESESQESFTEQVVDTTSDPMLGVQNGVEDIAATHSPRTREELLALDGVTLTEDGQLASVKISLLDTLSEEERSILLDRQAIATFSAQANDFNAEISEQFGLTNEQIEKGISLHGDRLAFTHELSDLRVNCDNMSISSIQMDAIARLIASGYTCSQAIIAYAATNTFELDLSDLESAKQAEIEQLMATGEESPDEDSEAGVEDYLAAKTGLPKALVLQIVASGEKSAYQIEQEMDGALARTFPRPDARQNDEYETASLTATEDNKIPYSPKEVLGKPYSYDQQGHFNINLSTGAYSYKETDLNIPGKNGLDLVLTRQFHSEQASTRRSMGSIAPTKGYRYDISNQTAFNVHCRWCIVDPNNGIKIIGELTNHDGYTFSDGEMAVYATANYQFPLSHYSEESLAEEHQINPPSSAETDTITALECKAFLEAQVGGYIFRVEDSQGKTYFLSLVPTITGVADIMEEYTESFSLEDSYLVDEFGLGHGWMFGFSHLRKEYPGYGDINTDDLQLRLTTSDGTQYFIDENVSTSGNYIENYDGNDIIFHKCVSGEYPGAIYGLYHKDGKIEYFDADGRNIAIVDRFGNKITLAYTFADTQKKVVSKIQIIDTVNNVVTYEKIDLDYNEVHKIGRTEYNGMWRLSLNGEIIREYYTYTRSWILQTTPNSDGSFSKLLTTPVQLIGIKDEAGEITRYEEGLAPTRFNCFLQPSDRTFGLRTALFSGDGEDLIISLKKVTYPNGAINGLYVSTPIETFGLNGYRHYSRCNGVTPLSSSDISNVTVQYTWGDFDGLEGQSIVHSGTYYTTVTNQQVYPFRSSDETLQQTGLMWRNAELKYTFSSSGQMKRYTKESYSAMPLNQEFVSEGYNWGDVQQTKWKSEAVEYEYGSKCARKPKNITTTYYNSSGKAEMVASESYIYDDKWNIMSYTKPNGSKETYTYDPTYSLPLTQTAQQDSSTTIKVTNTLSADKKRIVSSVVSKGSTTVGKSAFRHNSAGQLIAQDDYLSSTDYVTTAYEYGGGALPTQASVAGVKTATGTVAAGSPGFEAGTIARKQTYNDRGWITTQTDANGKTTSYNYDAVGRITKVTNPDDTTQTYTYNVPNSTVTYTDEAGSSWLCTYGDSGRLLTVKDLTSNKVLESYTYDHLDHLVKKVSYGDSTPNQTVYYRYDTDGRVIEQGNLDASGNVLYQELYEYLDGSGKITKTIVGDDSAPSIVTTSYQDNMGNVVKTGRFLDSKEYFDTFAYDYLGNQTQAKSAYNASLGDTYSTKTTYDHAGRVLTTTNILGQKTSKTYDWQGNQLTDTDPKGNVTRYTYDALGRLVRVVTPLDSGRTSQTDYTYDPNGNIIEERTRTGSSASSTTARVTTYEYNDLGRVILVKGNGKEDGQSGSDQLQYTQYVYDETGNITKMYTGLHAPLTINSNGGVTSTGDSSYSVTQYAYDRYSRLTQQTDARGETETYSYDLNGNLTSQTDRRGNTLWHSYDAMGRLISSASWNDSLEFTYTATNQRLTASSNGETNTYTYDSLGRLISEETPYATKAFAYNIGDLRTDFTVEDDTTVYLNNTYTYDKIGRLKTANGSGAQATYTYDANGNLSATAYNNNTTASYTYNNGNLPTQVQNKRSSTVLSKYTYTYGLDGNQLTKTDHKSRKTTYTYDGLNRLTKEVQTGTDAFTNIYTYDDYSNRSAATLSGTAASYTYDANNRLLSNTQGQNATTYTYDDQGNMTGSVLQYGGEEQASLDCVYDDFNRLIKVSDNSGKTVYTYDADGHRTSKTKDGVTEKYVWDGNQLVVTINPPAWLMLDMTLNRSQEIYILPPPLTAGKTYYAVIAGQVYSGMATREIDDSGATLFVRYPGEVPEIPPGYETWPIVLQLGNVDIRIEFDDDGGSTATIKGPANTRVQLYDGDPSRSTTTYVRGLSLVAAVDADGTRTYYHYNAHGDVVQLTNSSGTVTRDYTYDAFGVEKNADSSDANLFRYCGEQYDSETGNYYLRARYYSPAIGRFTQEDTHWNPSNMVYGDEPQKWNTWQGKKDTLNLHAYTYKPQATAVAQAGNLYLYCGNNPLLYVDPYGSAWYHWVIGGVIVAVAAAAVVVTAGGAVPALYAVGVVASGCAAGSAATTIAAGAFIGSSMVYGSAAFMAALNSGSIKDFNAQGNWGVVISTAAGAGVGGLYGYVLQKDSFLRSVTFDNKQVQKKFKHAGDYGVKGNWSSQNGTAFESAVRRQMQSVKNPILGTYRGTIQVYHFYDPKTGIDTMIKPDGSFYAGWRLSKAQIESLLRSGNIQ